MDFSTFDATYLIVALVMLLVLVLQGWLISRERAWLGVFVPAAYLAVLVYLGATDHVTSLGDFVFAAFGLLGLIAWWASAREARRHPPTDDEPLHFAPLTAADFSGSFPPLRTQKSVASSSADRFI